MNENIKETENSKYSFNENKTNNLLSDTPGLNKNKKKKYYLYKNGTKYILKKKEKEKNIIMKEAKSHNIKEEEDFPKKIYVKFKNKYSKMSSRYNSFIAGKLMHNISSHVVAVFKEFLIYGDIYEFLTKYYNRRDSVYLLKQIVYYYITNNIIYPNYIILPEGNYIFKNIQHKQKIIDNEEENKKDNKKDKSKEKREKILNSKVMDSILNQTDTSEARNCFDLKNNDINENEDNNEINLLIQDIDKIENQINKKKNFQKKKLIKIINNNNDLKRNNIYKLCEYINKNNILNQNNSNEQKNKDQNKNSNSPSGKSKIRELISSISNYQKRKRNFFYSTHNEKSNNNFLNMHKKMKTIEINSTNPELERLITDIKEVNKSSNLHSTSPYVIKRPINQRILINKKNICTSNSINKYYLKKTLQSFNKPDYLDFSPYKNNYKSENKSQIYIKKCNKLSHITSDLNIDSNSNITNKKINFNNNINNNNKRMYRNLIINKNLCNINTINYNADKQEIYNKIQNNSININKKKEKIEKYSNHTFKSIAKMLKKRHITCEDLLNNKISYHTFNGLKNKIISTPIIPKTNFEQNKDFLEDLTDSKNIYISNNITNNNYYTIDNNKENDSNSYLKRYKIKYEFNKDKLDIENKKESIRKKIRNKLLNSKSNILSINNIDKSNTIRINNDISRKLKNNGIISSYKNGLLDKTGLKSLDKYSLKYLLNKFSYSHDKIENKNIYSDNKKLELNKNKLKTINTEREVRDKNNIRLKRRYLILKDNNIRDIKKINTKLTENPINQKKEFYKTTNYNNQKYISSLSTKNSNRKIKY